jgi:hypothetical protein
LPNFYFQLFRRIYHETLSRCQFPRLNLYYKNLFVAFLLNARHKCFYYLGQIEEVLDFNKYEAFIEEDFDREIDSSLIEEVGTISLYKVGQRKVIFMKANDYHDTFYLISLTVKVRIFTQWNHFSRFYLKALRRMFNLRDMLLLYPTGELVLADPRYYRIIWFNISKSSAREI